MTVLDANERAAVREAIDQAQRARPRSLVKEMVAERPKRAYRRCPYCSWPCHGRACRDHWDLIEIERRLTQGGTAA